MTTSTRFNEADSTRQQKDNQNPIHRSLTQQQHFRQQCTHSPRHLTPGRCLRCYYLAFESAPLVDGRRVTTTESGGLVPALPDRPLRPPTASAGDDNSPRPPLAPPTHPAPLPFEPGAEVPPGAEMDMLDMLVGLAALGSDRGEGSGAEDITGVGVAIERGEDDSLPLPRPAPAAGIAVPKFARAGKREGGDRWVRTKARYGNAACTQVLQHRRESETSLTGCLLLITPCSQSSTTSPKLSVLPFGGGAGLAFAVGAVCRYRF